MKRETVKKHIETSNMSGHTKAKITDYITNLEIFRDKISSNDLKQWDKDMKIRTQQQEIERLKRDKIDISSLIAKITNKLNKTITSVCIQPYSMGSTPYSRSVLFPEAISHVLQEIKEEYTALPTAPEGE